jgi:hypothetical protein
MICAIDAPILLELGAPTIIIPGLVTTAMLLLTFGVYLFVDAARAPMYAGLTTRGLARPFETNHEGRVRGRQAGLDIVTWFLAFWSLPKAVLGDVEQRMKTELQPRFNGETLRAQGNHMNWYKKKDLHHGSNDSNGPGRAWFSARRARTLQKWPSEVGQ